jgi:plastocyanin
MGELAEKPKIARGLKFKASSKTRLSIAILSSILLLGGAAIIAISYQQKTTPQKNPTARTAGQVEVSVTRQGFVPAVITIKKGATVVWVNNDDDDYHSIASNPYPSNSDLPQLHSVELNVSDKYVNSSHEHHSDSSKVESNKTNAYSFAFNRTGTFGYHDGIHPELNGSVIVKE